MIICYGLIKKRDKRKKNSLYEVMNDQIEFDMDWNSEDDHARLRQAIHEKHPGWMISGYAPQEREVRYDLPDASEED